MVCGSRKFKDRDKLYRVLNKLQPTTIIQGECSGADKMSKEWGITNNKEVLSFPANWSLGKRAGPMRNTEMLKKLNSYSNKLVVAFLTDDPCKGTWNTIKQARKMGLEVKIIE